MVFYDLTRAFYYNNTKFNTGLLKEKELLFKRTLFDLSVVVSQKAGVGVLSAGKKNRR